MKPVTEVAVRLIQGQTGAFAEQIQGRHSVSAFSNLVSIPIVALGLSGHYNSYQATIAVICNKGA